MVEMLFPRQPADLPKKKFRGMARHFKKLKREAENFVPSLHSDDWYDFWHYHADWDSNGNMGWRIRKKYIDVLSVIFRKFSNQVKNFSKPFQIWFFLDQKDAGQDAVFFHTPNPNRENFPYQIPGIQWGIPFLEEYFSRLFPSLQFRAGSLIFEGSKVFLIYPLSLGEPL